MNINIYYMTNIYHIYDYYYYYICIYISCLFCVF